MLFFTDPWHLQTCKMIQNLPPDLLCQSRGGLSDSALMALLSFWFRNSQWQEMMMVLTNEVIISQVQVEDSSCFGYSGGFTSCTAHILLSEYDNWVLNAHNGFFSQALCHRCNGEYYLAKGSHLKVNFRRQFPTWKTVFSRQPSWLVSNS